MHGFWGIRQKLFRHVNPILRDKHDLDMSAYFLLQYVSGSDLGPSEIAEALQMPAHAISRKLDSLERGGFLERTLDPKDARKRVLTITTRGKGVLREASQTMNEEVETMLSALEPEALEQFLTSLEALSTSETL